MDRNTLIKEVALRMDEITPENGIKVNVDGSDGNPLYALIDGVADDCALELYSVAPYYRLPQTRFLANDIASSEVIGGGNPRNMIRLRLSDDFLRVAEIDFVTFQRPITEVVVEQSPEGRRQHNRFLMGKEAKPVGVLSYGLWDGTTCREIDCYSYAVNDVPSGTFEEQVIAFYIAKPPLAHLIPEILIPSLEWTIASRVFGSRGDVTRAEICQRNAQNVLV